MYQYQFPDLKEASQHGSSSFPCAFYQLQATGHGVLVKHHWHEEIEMLYFPEGNFCLEINMETFTITSECFYFINPGELHSISTHSKTKASEYAVVFGPELLGSPFYDAAWAQLIQPLQKGSLLFPRCISKEHSSFLIMKELFQTITDAFFRCSSSELLENTYNKFHTTLFRASDKAVMDLVDQLLVKASLLQILAELTRWQLFSQTENPDDHRIETIKTVITYMQKHYQDKIYIRDLASLVGLNEQYFCRFFKKTIGISPVEYLNEYRIRQAMRFLTDTSLPVTEVCLECGYNNMGNFLREFRRYTQTTPLQYRKHSSVSDIPTF